MRKEACSEAQQGLGRESFSSALAVFFATLGSAVGLGNIWKFPYLVGMNGGGAFVLVYMLCIVMVGLPIMIGEFYIGKKTKKNVVGAVKELSPRSKWSIIGYMGLTASFLIMFFYSGVAGWVYSYVFRAIRGDFKDLSTMGTDAARQRVSELFAQTMEGAWSPMVWQLIVMSLVAVVLILGIKKGIERITKTLLPVLFILIIFCAVRGLTLPNGMMGVSFLFKPDFSKLGGPAVLAALGLAFFKLSIGMGAMTTYASYFNEESKIMNTGVRVALSDTLISLLAGLAIFPAVFSFGMEPSMGPGLLFETIPLVFSKMPLGNLLITAFFLLTAIAATTAMISLVEPAVAYLSEEIKLSRTKAVLVTAGTITLVGVLTVHPASVFGSVRLFSMGFFDLFDYISSNILLPIGGFLIALFVGWKISEQSFIEEISNHGRLAVEGSSRLFRFLLRYITPILVVLVFLNSIGVL